MTARQVFEGVLIEVNKVEAPSLLLEDFNYFINKAVNQYVNKHYNIYDTNQQSTDDLRVLKATTVLTPQKVESYGTSNLYGAVYEVQLPADYLHILNCVCEFLPTKPFKCYNANECVQFAARRLTADTWPTVINNFYLKPSYKRPYFYLHQVNTSATSSNGLPTNPYIADQTKQTLGQGTDYNGAPFTIDTSNGIDIRNLASQITLNNSVVSLVEKPLGTRISNPSSVILEIRFGKDDSLFQLQKLYIDYLKSPQYIRITQTQFDTVEDTSQIMEFPDYVCQEIINELALIIMENASDPRTKTNYEVHQSIAPPTQQGQNK